MEFCYKLRISNYKRRIIADSSAVGKEQQEADTQQDKEPCSHELSAEKRCMHESLYNYSEEAEFSAEESSQSKADE